MKLYLSSYRIPVPEALAQLVGKPLGEIKVALIPNAKDYYIRRAKDFTTNEIVVYLEELGFKVTVVDLQDYSDSKKLKDVLSDYDLIWARGGNTYMLRYQMRRSGFEHIIGELLEQGIVYGGDSAGALVAGVSIAGVEAADEPSFAEAVIGEGLDLVPYAILPHIDNPQFAAVVPIFHEVQADENVIALKDSQAVVFDGNKHAIVNGKGIA
jgi:dipeptidase E